MSAQPGPSIIYPTLPRSKSIAARALILSDVYSLNDSGFITEWPDCDDTGELKDAISELRQPESPDYYNLGNGGTSLRFFLALAASLSGFNGIIDCGDQLRKRPVKPLVDALRQAGADITYINHDGRPPLRVIGKKLDGKGVNVDASVSSQFVSALILVSDLWKNPFVLPDGYKSCSRPYTIMSAKMREIFRQRALSIAIISGFEIEYDWSAAAFFYEWVLTHPDAGLQIGFRFLTPPCKSLQGDSACEALFAELGVETYRPDTHTTVLRCDIETINRLRHQPGLIQFAMDSTPDLVPPMVVGMCRAGIKFKMTGVASLRHKESNRLEALREELKKAGFILEIGDNHIAWTGATSPNDNNFIFRAHDDHRMAMALTAAYSACRLHPDDLECVNKSFPDFFSSLSRMNR